MNNKKVMTIEDEKVVPTVKVSWKDNKVGLHNNCAYATQRLKNTEMKLSKDDELSRAYKDIINQYLEKGFIRKVNDLKEEPTMWYLPHFPVIRNEKLTTKVRIVFDAAAKTNGISLTKVRSFEKIYVQY